MNEFEKKMYPLVEMLKNRNYRIRFHPENACLFAGRPFEDGVLDPFSLEREEEGVWLVRRAGPGQLSRDREFLELDQAVSYIINSVLES